jgi:SOS-response transcriptional repressor LexA
MNKNDFWGIRQSMGQKEAWKDFVTKLEEWKAEGVKYDEIARRLGEKHRSKVARILNGTHTGQRVNPSEMIGYLKAVGLNPDDYFSLGPSPEDYEYIPKVEARLGAGGSFVVSDEITNYYAFRKEFVRHLGCQIRDLVLFEVQGESMQNMLFDGDTVLVDQSDRRVKDGKLYALRIDDELMVKKLQKMPGQIVAKSENPDFGDIEIPINQEAQNNVEIYGRVRWIGRVV